MLFILQFSLISESDYLMKLLVTGASGNIGTVLKSKLQENDIPFIGVDITNQNSSNNNFFQLDITNENELQEKKSVFDNIDTLIHLASKIDAGADVTNTGIESINVNIKGTLNLLEHLPNLKNILFTSTYMVYGIPQQNPVTENHIQEPHTVYGTSKIVTEKYLQIYAQEKGIDLTIFRYMGIYGLMSHYANQAIPIFIRKALRNEPINLYENSLRDYIHVSDVIEAIMSAIKLNQNGLFNIGTGIKSPSHLVVEKIIEITKSQSEILHSEKSGQYDFVCDISKSTTELGINPKVSIEKGLADEILWHKSQIQKSTNNDFKCE